MRTAAMAISTSAILLVATADTARGDDLRGYSIDATYSTGVYSVGNIGKGNHHAHRGHPPVLHHDRIYISTKGNVFAYLDTGEGHSEDVSELDQAILMSLGRMAAWTVEPARLLRVIKEPEGFLVETIEIDPSKSSCSVSSEAHPDPQTSRVILQLPTGAMREIRAYDISNANSPTCIVRKGNIFAGDQ